LPRLESGDFDFGRWAGGERQADGSILMPYYDFSRDALDLIGALPVTVFPWPEWTQTDEARALLADHARIAHATPQQLVKLTTALVRGDRFGEGTLASAWGSGLLMAIVRRAAAIVNG
jgi:hypothetical protein